MVDGVSNEGECTGSNLAGHSAEAIREFRVITQQDAAGYGQASGGVVNMVTRSRRNAEVKREESADHRILAIRFSGDEGGAQCSTQPKRRRHRYPAAWSSNMWEYWPPDMISWR